MTDRPKNPHDPGEYSDGFGHRVWSECAAAYDPIVEALEKRVAELEAKLDSMTSRAVQEMRNARSVNACTPADRYVLDALSRVLPGCLARWRNRRKGDPALRHLAECETKRRKAHRHNLITGGERGKVEHERESTEDAAGV